MSECGSRTQRRTQRELPAALVRAAFDLFESCYLNAYTKKKKTTQWVVLLLVETTGLEPVTSCV